MTAPDTAQKGFYDDKRQFQGKDEPTRDAAPLTPPSAAPPLGQVIAGVIFLAVIALGFFFFALPEKPAPITAPAAPAALPAAK